MANVGDKVRVSITGDMDNTGDMTYGVIVEKCYYPTVGGMVKGRVTGGDGYRVRFLKEDGTLGGGGYYPDSIEVVQANFMNIPVPVYPAGGSYRKAEPKPVVESKPLADLSKAPADTSKRTPARRGIKEKTEQGTLFGE